VTTKKVWDTPDPTKKDRKHSKAKTTPVIARVKAAGLPYPNLVDNMAVLKKAK
jgi:hypothetical protein